LQENLLPQISADKRRQNIGVPKTREWVIRVYSREFAAKMVCLCPDSSREPFFSSSRWLALFRPSSMHPIITNGIAQFLAIGLNH